MISEVTLDSSRHVFKIWSKTNTVNIAVKLCETYSNTPKSMHIPWKFNQILRAGNFKKLLIWDGMKRHATSLWILLLSTYQYSKIEGLAWPLNVIQSSYNFAGFTSMSKRNLSWDGQLYLRAFMFWDTLLMHTYNVYMHECIPTYIIHT